LSYVELVLYIFTVTNIFQRYENFLLKASQVLRTMKRRSLGIAADGAVENGAQTHQSDDISKTGALLLDDLTTPDNVGSLNAGNEDFKVAAQRVETLLKQIKVGYWSGLDGMSRIL
jgi:hypothetical protein